MKKIIAICVTVISMSFFFIGCNAGNFDTEANKGESTKTPEVTADPMLTSEPIVPDNENNEDDGILGDAVEDGADAAGDIVRNGADAAGNTVRDSARRATRKATGDI